MSSYYLLPKIPKYDGRNDPAKHLNSYKTHVSLRGATFIVKYKAFHLTLNRATKIRYSRLSFGSIRSWLEFKSTFLKRCIASNEGEASIDNESKRRSCGGQSKLLDEYFSWLKWREVKRKSS